MAYGAIAPFDPQPIVVAWLSLVLPERRRFSCPGSVANPTRRRDSFIRGDDLATGEEL
jgi:hypothetical protein